MGLEESPFILLNMTETELVKLLKGHSLNKSALYLKADALTEGDKKDIDLMLSHLVEKGIIGFHGSLYYLLSEQGISLAKVTMKKKNFVVLVSVSEGKEIKISGPEADGLLIGDFIYVKKAQGNYHGIDYLKATDSFTGRFSLTSSGKTQLLVDYLNQCGKTVLITEIKEGLDIHQGDLVKCEILGYGSNTYRVKASQLLVRASDVGSDISMIIKENDAPTTFSDAAIQQAKNIPQTLKEEDYIDRVDLRNENIVTIDGDDAHDFDDAVSIERNLNGYKVIVSIADVTHYMRPNSPLDNDAIERATSIYVADRVVPMLPFELSNGICSLNPDVDRLTLSVIMYLDGMGNVYSSKVVKSVIHSHARLTYRQVNSYLRNEENDLNNETKKLIDVLYECAIKVRKRRTRQGALKLSSTELKFKLDEEGVPTDVVKVEQGESEMMIEDFMILANCEVAKLLRSHNIPVLYRVHEFPKMEKVSDFKDFIKKMDPKLIGYFPRTKDLSGARLNDFISSIGNEDLKSVISYMMLRALQKAKYTPEELGHFGLAEPYYCHFTSPIRRYPDDIIHRLVKDYLIDGKEFSYDDIYSYLVSMGDITSQAEVRADKIEREVEDLEACKYMAKHIGETYKAKVIGIINKGMFVEMESGIEGFLSFHCMHGDAFSFNERTYSVEGKYHPEYSFTIGTKLNVTIMSVDVDRGEIDLATPEFYAENALDLSEEDRIELARYGIYVEQEEDPDFEEYDKKPTSYSKNKGDREFFDEHSSYSKDEPKEEKVKTTTRSGYHSSKKTEEKKEKKSFRKSDTRGFDSQIRSVEKKDDKFKKKQSSYHDHQGYDAKIEDSKPRRRHFDHDENNFEREKFRSDDHKSYGKKNYGDKKPYSKDRKPYSGEKKSFSKDKKYSFDRKHSDYKKPSYKKDGYSKDKKFGGSKRPYHKKREE